MSDRGIKRPSSTEEEFKRIKLRATETESRRKILDHFKRRLTGNIEDMTRQIIAAMPPRSAALLALEAERDKMRALMRMQKVALQLPSLTKNLKNNQTK